VRTEKDEFDRSLVTFQAMRSVYAKLTNEVFAELGLGKLREDVKATRLRMLERMSFSTQMRTTMGEFFKQSRARLDRAQLKTDEIAIMVTNMYLRFAEEHGIVLAAPMGFSLTRYRNEIDRVERVYQERFGLLTVFTTEQIVLTQKFFESIASRVKVSFENSNRDAEAWLKAIIAPLEGQMREHQTQLKRRLESIRHIQDASETLEERIGEVNAQQVELERLNTRLSALSQTISWTLQASIDAEQGALII